MSDVRIFPDEDSLARAAANRFVQDANQAIAARGRFAVALAGGSTPRPLYTRLASPEFARLLDWTRVHVFWGDERCVPPEDARSNYRMARETLLDAVAIPHASVHRIRGEADPRSAASAYEKVLREFFRREGPGPVVTFDLVLLGLGEDGHTASLFPGRRPVAERERWVLADYLERASMWRITLTPVPLNLASHVLFVVSGAPKAGCVRDVLEGPSVPDTLPAQATRPAHARLSWYLDQAAGAGLRAK